MIVTTESGRRLTIPAHHSVFSPVGDYGPGDDIDPTTTDVDSDLAVTLKCGRLLIIDNRVEKVATVAA